MTLHGQKVGTDALGENMEEGNGVFNVFEVGGNLQLAAEAPPLALGGGMFLEDIRGETLVYFLLCSMVVSCSLHADSRGSRRQGLLCEKCVRNLEINCWSGRSVIRNAASAILLSSSRTRPMEVWM